MVLQGLREDWEKMNGVIQRLKPQRWHFGHCGSFCQSSVSYFSSLDEYIEYHYHMYNTNPVLNICERGLRVLYLGLGPKMKGAAEYFSTRITQPTPTLEIHSCPASWFLPLCPYHGNGVGVVVVVLMACSVSYAYTRPSSEYRLSDWLAQSFYESTSKSWSRVWVRRLIACWCNWFISSTNFLSGDLKCR